MITSIGHRSLLQTKLHRPRVTADLVQRPRLQEALDNGLDRPLILVAAPAGFGKSTLVSAWLETCDLPHAWISLDEADNDLGVFLAYFLAAVQSLFPDALPETGAFLTGISLPAVTVIARSLINELDGLEREVILVLDDYHLIRAQPVHELLSLLLQHPPQGLHLVIATRQDPSLPLGVLRARNQVAEIRGYDLRFSLAEIAAFVERTLGAALADDALAVLAEQRHALMDSEQWQLLERCLHMFPAETVADYPDLLLTNAWLTELNRSDPQHVRETVNRAADLVTRMADQPDMLNLSGEIDALRAMAAYMAATDPEHVITLARRVLETTPRAWYFVRAVAWFRLAVAHQMAGRLDRAYAALAEGQPEDVAQNGAVRARVAGWIDSLTDREREVLALLAQRLTAKEIAQALVISPMTVKRHTSTIYHKLQVNRRREAVAEAIRLGLL